jgi:hypothetical protein
VNLIGLQDMMPPAVRCKMRLGIVCVRVRDYVTRAWSRLHLGLSIRVTVYLNMEYAVAGSWTPISSA